MTTTSLVQQPLPSQWVDRVFAKLIGVYGNQFGAKFSQVVDGVDIGIALAKQAWAEELAGFSDKPEAIAYALKNLPRDFPPNAIQFAELCRDGAKRIEPKLPALTHTYDYEHAKERMAEVMAVLRGKVGP